MSAMPDFEVLPQGEKFFTSFESHEEFHESILSSTARPILSPVWCSSWKVF